jgi:prepilin-type N-terminal cleavage/methylation domain-containing protein
VPPHINFIIKIMFNKKSFTLMEILVVVIIIGILAALALPNFGVSKERALDREAKATLSSIQDAEKFYKLQSGYYYPSSSTTSVIADINTNLKISLPTGGFSWTYVLDGDNYQATAARYPSINRTWTLTFGGGTATCSSTDSSCPPS